MKQVNQVRIIGGKWRGRKLRIAKDHIRPTTDRIRETVFNWLAPYIEEAKCLDLFAGSGALGFEALSRGAAKVVMVDKSRRVIDMLRTNAANLGTDNVQFVCTKFGPNWRYKFTDKFDIVFLDPPFYKDLLNLSCVWLVNSEILATNALVYLEGERAVELDLPQGWEVLKDKISGGVRYMLVRCKPG